MNITFHGAAQTVTGSRHLIEINGHRLLLDCGLYQGRRKETYDRNLNFPFEADSVDAVLLSHAHIDHSGNLPNLVRQGFTGPIHATHATVHLTDIMTRDSGHIQEYDVQFVNKRRARKGKPPIEPLYTVEDAAAAAKQLESQEYDVDFDSDPWDPGYFRRSWPHPRFGQRDPRAGRRRSKSASDVLGRHWKTRHAHRKRPGSAP